MGTELLSSSISKRHKRKHKRDHITVFSHQRKNRRFRKTKRRRHNNERKTIYREKERGMIEEVKPTSPEQNTINLSSKVLSPAEKSLLKKGPSFAPTPTDINWCNLLQDFDSFVNKLRFHALKTEKNHVEDTPTSTALSVETFQLVNPPVKAKSPSINFRREKTNVSSLETFIELVEKDPFQLATITK